MMGILCSISINLPTENPNDAYYASHTTTADSGKQLVFNESGYLYIVRDNGKTVPLKQVRVDSIADFYYRATLNFDGVFTQYSHPKTSNTNESWTPLWSVPDNICVASSIYIGSGTCGYNNICTLKPDRRPMCKCPKGYSLLDPNDQYGSCKPYFIQGCEEDKQSHGEDLYTFEQLINTDWPNADYAFLKPFTEDQCRKSCMEYCMCAVAIFRLGDSCWKKKLPLSNGKVDSSLDGGKAFIKIQKNNSITLPDHSLSIPEAEKKNKDNLILMWSILLGGSVFVNIIAICFGVFFIYHKKLKRPLLNVTAVEKILFYLQRTCRSYRWVQGRVGKGSFWCCLQRLNENEF